MAVLGVLLWGRLCRAVALTAYVAHTGVVLLAAALDMYSMAPQAVIDRVLTADSVPKATTHALYLNTAPPFCKVLSKVRKSGKSLPEH
eukprot:5773-Heterococcus_DN1.PRE.2